MNVDEFQNGAKKVRSQPVAPRPMVSDRGVI